MITLLKLLAIGAVALFVVLPAVVLLTVVGTPLLGALGLMAIPVMVIVAIVGMPVLLIGVMFAVVIGLVLGALGLVVGLGLVLVKVALLVVLPVLVVWWVVRRVFAIGASVEPGTGRS